MKKIVGVFSDGNETKLAILEKRGNTYALVDLISHNENQNSSGYTNGYGEKDKLVLDDSVPIVLDSDSSNGENEKLTLAYSLSKYNLKELVFIPAVTEPNVSYNLFSETKKLDKKSLNKRLIEQWKQFQKASPDIKNINAIQYPDNTILSIYSNEYFPILNQLEHLAESAKYKNLQIPQVASADILLADYVIKKFPLIKENTYLIVYIGYDASRLIFITENKIKYISGYLSFGAHSLELDTILSSKVNLESENAQISKIDKAFICGEILQPEVLENIRNSEEFTDIEILNLESLNKNALREELRDLVPSFIIPILAAINYTSPINPLHSKLNLLPPKLIESQKVFKIGISGTILLIIIFIVAALFTHLYLINNQKIQNKKAQITSLKPLVTENQIIKDSIKIYEEKIASIDKVLANLDTLVPGAERWTEFLDKLHEYNLNNKRIWINSISSDKKTNIIVATGINRTNLPNFADYLDYSILRSITNATIREKPIFKFEIEFDPTKYGLKGLKNESQN